MKRAAVLIGVDRTGDLPPLKDAANGAREMERWAHSQQMSPVVTLTDEKGGEVAVASVKEAIKDILSPGLSSSCSCTSPDTV